MDPRRVSDSTRVPISCISFSSVVIIACNLLLTGWMSDRLGLQAIPGCHRCVARVAIPYRTQSRWDGGWTVPVPVLPPADPECRWGRDNTTRGDDVDLRSARPPAPASLRLANAPLVPDGHSTHARSVLRLRTRRGHLCKTQPAPGGRVPGFDVGWGHGFGGGGGGFAGGGGPGWFGVDGVGGVGPGLGTWGLHIHANATGNGVWEDDGGPLGALALSATWLPG